MKKKLSLIFLLLVSIGFAQPPAGYYNSATGTGYTLKTQLHDIITANYIDKTYSGLYITYTTSDKDFYYENDGTMLDVYTENPTGPECEFTYGTGQDDGSLGNNECERYNREHLIPQSVFASATPMYSDAHFVLPSDKHVNGQRGDLPFGRVDVANYTSTNGSKKGSNLNSGYSSGYTGIVFEPIDEFKGDIARCLLYFATRYEDEIKSNRYTYTMFDGTSTQVFTDTFKNILLTWNAQDPVSTRELARNNAIYTRQKNRNPYIDNNTYVTKIWGSALATNSFELVNGITVFPNPSKDSKINIQTELPLDEISLVTINGQLIEHVKKPYMENNIYTLKNLNSGFYFLKLTSIGQSIVKKIVLN